MIILTCGKSGSGKSTLIKALKPMISGSVSIHSDEIRQFLYDTTKDPAIKYSKAANIAVGSVSKGRVAVLVSEDPSRVIFVETIGLSPMAREDWREFALGLKQEFKLLWVREPISLDDWKRRLANDDRHFSEADWRVVETKQYRSPVVPEPGLYPQFILPAEDVLEPKFHANIAQWIKTGL